MIFAYSKKKKEISKEISIGTQTFDKLEAFSINRARLEHLDSLGLDLEKKTVIDVGCGVGHLAQFFLKKNCKVFCVDGREENIQKLRSLYSGLESRVVNVEEENLSKFGKFDIVFCYGLLYHCSKPAVVLENISSVCRELLILETCIADYPYPALRLVQETDDFSQSLYGIGSRPTPSYIILNLIKSGFKYIYYPKKTPNHPDFHFKYRGDFSIQRNGHPIRQIFIASKFELFNPNLKLVNNEIHFKNEEGLKSFIKHKIKNFASSLGKIIPDILLIKILPLFYRRQPTRFFPNWVMGAGSKENFYRVFLNLMWEIFSAKARRRMIVSWDKDIKISLYSKNEIDRCIYIEGMYEPNQFYFLDNFLKKGMVFVDIGANTGLYSLFASKKVGDEGLVIAAEPSPRELRHFRENISLNNFSNIKIYEGVVVDKIGKEKLKIAEEGHEGHNTLGSFVYKATRLKEIREVNAITLDEFLEKFNLRRLDCIKIDVEGAELKVLQGGRRCIRKYTPVILFELSDLTLSKQGSSSKEVWDFLEDLGYCFYTFDSTTKWIKKTQFKRYYESENIIAIHSSKTKQIKKMYVGER